jgi:hypothetical protein
MKHILVALVWLVAPFLAVAQDSSKIIAMENLWNRAELNNDAPAIQLLLADDFVMNLQQGTDCRLRGRQIVPSDCSPVQRPGSSFVRQHSRRNRRLLRKGCRQRQALGAPWTLHRYLDEPER